MRFTIVTPDGIHHPIVAVCPWKYTLNSLTDIFTDAWQIRKPLDFYLVEEKGFLDPDVTLDRLPVMEDQTIVLIQTVH